jgi:uncharacterized membrane protein
MKREPKPSAKGLARHAVRAVEPAVPPATGGRWAVLALAVAYAALFSFLCVQKYRYYLYNDFDLAIFAHAVEGVLRGSFFESIRGMNWLGDHSSLILVPLAPLYALFHDARTLLIIQTCALAAGAWPAYWLARTELDREWAAVCCAALYLLFPALQYSNLFEFHPETLATPALLLAFHHLRGGRTGAALVATGLALLTREDVALVAGMMAGYALVLRRPGGWRAAAGLAVLAAASLIATYAFLRPAFNAGQAQYGWLYVDWGRTPVEVVGHVLSDPGAALMALFTTFDSAFETTVKQQYYLHMLLPLAFLPLLSPITLLIAAPIVLGHFLTWRYQQHSIVYHYTALVTPFVVAAAIMGLRNLSRRTATAAAAKRGGARTASRHGSPATDRRVALAVACGLALACALASQALFGPFAPGGRWRRLTPAESLWPGPEARALKPHRDRLLAERPRAGGVLASFELLSHLTRAADVHSLHNLLSGRYTFSNLPYAPPTGVTSMVVDLSAPSTSDAVLASGARLRETCRINGLKPVAAAGDLVAFAEAPRDTVALLGPGSLAGGAAPPIVYDRMLALVDVEPVDREARPGEILEFRARWMRVAPADRLFLMRLVLRDGRGQTAYEHARNLGYGLYPVHDWPAYAPMAETVRLLVPAGLAAGHYELGFTMGWRTDEWAVGDCVADDPARGAFVRVGTIRLAAARSPGRSARAAAEDAPAGGAGATAPPSRTGG